MQISKCLITSTRCHEIMKWREKRWKGNTEKTVSKGYGWNERQPREKAKSSGQKSDRKTKRRTALLS